MHVHRLTDTDMDRDTSTKGRRESVGFQPKLRTIELGTHTQDGFSKETSMLRSEVSRRVASS